MRGPPPTVKVRFYATLREITNTAEIDIACERCRDVGDVLKVLISKFGDAFEKEIYEKGDLKVKILLNGRDIEFIDKLRSAVSADDVLHLFPPIGGG